jgi:hypothetical protein
MGPGLAGDRHQFRRWLRRSRCGTALISGRHASAEVRTSSSTPHSSCARRTYRTKEERPTLLRRSVLFIGADAFDLNRAKREALQPPTDAATPKERDRTLTMAPVAACGQCSSCELNVLRSPLGGDYVTAVPADSAASNDSMTISTWASSSCG